MKKPLFEMSLCLLAMSGMKLIVPTSDGRMELYFKSVFMGIIGALCLDLVVVGTMSIFSVGLFHFYGCFVFYSVSFGL